jgi:hypothetical protein
MRFDDATRSSVKLFSQIRAPWLPRKYWKIVAIFFVGFACFLSPFRASAVEPATVSFTLDFPNSDPEHYTISVNSDGHAKYEVRARISQESEDRETYQFEFEVSPVNRARIFDLTAQAKYFAGKIDSGNKKLAFTGAKQLTYHDGKASHAADYNYSTLPSVQELTALFQGVSQTLDYARRLAYYHRYQKLALDAELKSLEAQAKSNNLSELQALAPLLQEISEDASVMNVVRARAQRLIEMGKVLPPAASR